MTANDNSTIKKIGNRWLSAQFSSDVKAKFDSEVEQYKVKGQPYVIRAADGKILVKGQLAVGRVIFA